MADGTDAPRARASRPWLVLLVFIRFETTQRALPWASSRQCRPPGAARQVPASFSGHRTAGQSAWRRSNL